MRNLDKDKKDKYEILHEFLLFLLIINFILNVFLKSNTYNVLANGIIGTMFILCGNESRKRKESFDFKFYTVIGILTYILLVLNLIKMFS